MVTTVLNIAAGAFAAVGLFGILWGAMSSRTNANLIGLRLAQGGMALAGASLLVKGFIGGGSDGFLYGPILLVFATAITAIKPARGSGSAK